MGVLCSKAHPEDQAAGPEQTTTTTTTTTTHLTHSGLSTKDHTMCRDSQSDKASAKRLLDVHDDDILSLNPPPPSKKRRDIGDTLEAGFSSPDDYFHSRQQLMALEKTLDFDFRCRARATPLEKRVDSIIQVLKRRDSETVYDSAPYRRGFGGQLHRRFPGDNFLSNVDLISHTAVFDVARHMPKGAHLHIHFNACLLPHVLLDIAKGMDRMFITSDLPLTPDNNYESFDRCEIQFSLMCVGSEEPGDLFSPNYKPRQTMKFSDFLTRFPEHYGKASADEWLTEKLVFHDEEAHNMLQTAEGAWEKFNGRTRMMKGLFNYETAYRKYTRLCLEDFMKDNIQYAEIRPNFMTSNQLYHDDGTGPIDNWGILRIIVDEVERFQADMTREGRFFGGLKVIYCTPRSFTRGKVKAALDECLQFKKEWPQWIAGFDIVGEETAGFPLRQFVPEFLQFQRDCDAEGVEIPFLFHCGETLDIGTDTDGNLVDALLLRAKRIGHGFGLAKHPYVMQHMKARGVCLELCPISNEVLGLTPRVNGHAMYELLANNVHCTVNSDNGTLFRSSLSHDFYQVMVGKADLGLAGWKQLILWSIEHACMDDAERAAVIEHWEKQWEEFLEWLVNKYGHVVEGS